jgi:Flp pilus assembly protein TadD
MTFPLRAGAALAGALAAALAGPLAPPAARDPEAPYRAHNRGVALLEQYRHDEAAAAFREALKLDPGLALARVNLAIALLNQQKHEEARTEAKAAAALLPDRPHPLYVWALAARGLADAADAEAALRKALALDPQDVGTRVNLGQLLMQARKYPEAIEQLRAAVAAEEHNATAAYNLGQALIRAGQADEAQRAMERFRELREAGYGTFLGQTYPEQGRYAEALLPTGAEPSLVDATRPGVKFAAADARWLPGARPGTGTTGTVLLADLDLDGDLDVVDAGTEGLALLVSDGGKALADATARWGLDPRSGGTGAAAGDVDNDGRPDLLVLSPRGVRLLKNGGAAFADITSTSGLPADAAASAGALVDLDHDGDLDVVLGGRLFQSDGTPRFKEVTQAAGVSAATDLTAVVPTDYDERRDVDLLLAGAASAPRLFQNRRNGTFRDVAAAAGLGEVGGALAVATADVDKDGYPDFFFGREDGPGTLARSNGKGGFTRAPVPGSAGARRALFLDYDNDGLLDLVVLTARGPRVLRSLGGRGWDDVSADAAMPTLAADAAPSALAAGDLDGDGDTDLVLRVARGLQVLENQGGRNRSLRVSLAGLVSNRSGVGAKVEMRSGSLRQKLETSAAFPPVAPADVVFGLGPRTAVDAVRVLWPAGVLQTEIPEAPGPRMAIKELDRKPSSCPYLYAWDGRQFGFVTDFMGGGEMGYWVGPGQYNQPDPDEYVRLTDEQLRPRDGRLELRVTNELEEALFVDRLALLAVDHPAGVEVYPDEALRHVAPRFRLVAVRDPRPVRAARDDRGRDVLDRLAAVDRRFADGFAVHRIRGYAEEHALTLDLGPAGDDAVLLLTGWTDYAFSKDNVAAHQAGLALSGPRLEVEAAGGGWQTVVEDVGIPVGRPQTVLVEMKGRWRGPSRRVRIVTNMRIYWDQARVGASVPLSGSPARLDAAAADLRERGFSAEVSPDGREPYTYDYRKVGWASPWKAFPGRYTRVGDVRVLLSAVDDLFVLSKPGDEVALSFDAASLPPLAAGWRRTYLLHADGYSKEMDIHSATPDQLGPLPFHGMPSYPYVRPAAYPMTPERQALMDAYNTRVVAAPVPPLELALAQQAPR